MCCHGHINRNLFVSSLSRLSQEMYDRAAKVLEELEGISTLSETETGMRTQHSIGTVTWFSLVRYEVLSLHKNQHLSSHSFFHLSAINRIR